MYTAARDTPEAAPLNLPIAQWKRDDREYRHLLRFGESVAREVARSMIDPGHGSALQNLDLSRAVSAEQMAVEMFREKLEQGVKGSWGELVEGQVRVFGELTRLTSLSRKR